MADEEKIVQDEENITQEKASILDWAYETALVGPTGIQGAIELAEKYKDSRKTVKQDVDALIRNQVIYAGAMGFSMGFGGILTMPVTIPVNVASVLFLQTRMIIAIAHLGGHDVKENEDIKTLCLACLCGNGVKEVLKNVGIEAGRKITMAALERLPARIFVQINQSVGRRLLTKFGQRGVVNLHKAIPLASGLIGAGIDAGSTKIIGKVARTMFIEDL